MAVPLEALGEAETAPRSAPKPAQKAAQLGRLEDDPRFALMQGLFPGRVTDWQENEADAQDSLPGGGTSDEEADAEAVDSEADT